MKTIFTLIALLISLGASAQAPWPLPSSKAQPYRNSNLSSALSADTNFFVNNYILTVDNAPYQNLVGDSVLTPDFWDDPIYEVPLGFSFNFFFVPLDTIRLENFLTFSTNDAVVGYVIPQDVDIIAREDGTPSTISYVVEGAPGSRIFKAQWRNVSFYCLYDDGSGERSPASTDSASTNFQVWLYESNGRIEVRQGPYQISSQSEAFCDYGGPIVGIAASDFESENPDEVFYAFLGGNPANPELITEQNGPDFFEDPPGVLDSLPPVGTVYSFIPQFTSLHSRINAAALRMYPNPATDVVRFERPHVAGAYTAHLQDMTGRTVATTSGQGPEGKLSVAALPPGVYVLRVRDAAGLYQGRIVRQ